MRHFFFPCANRGASLVHAHVCRKGGKITGHGVRADPRRDLPFSLLLGILGNFLSSLHQCYSLHTFAHLQLKEHS